MPKGSDADKQMSYEESNHIGSSVTPTPELANAVIATLDKDGLIQDEVGYKELSTRAQKGDQIARKAILDIVTSSNNKKVR